VGWWDRAAIIALGGAGCALSYDALRQMAVAIHVRPQLAYLFPLVIDGFIAYGIRALLVMSTAPLRARLYVWTLFATATTASIWANALHAVRLNQQTHQDGLRLGNNVVAVLSTIAPLALAGAVHLYILITRHRPARDPNKDQPRPDQPAALVPLRADPDGTIRTGPQDPLRHRVRADHTRDRDHDLRPGQAVEPGPDRRNSGPDHAGGPHSGPADHAEAGPPLWTNGPGHRADHTTADQEPPDHGREDHCGPDRQGPATHGTATPGVEDNAQPTDHNPDPADPPRDHADPPAAQPQTPSEPASDNEPEATTSEPAEKPAGQTLFNEPTPDRGGNASVPKELAAQPPVETANRTRTQADQTEDADQKRGSADHSRTVSKDQPSQGPGGPDHPTGHDRRGDRTGGPADHDRGPAGGTGGPDPRADHGPEDHRTVAERGPARNRRTGPEPESAEDQPHPPITDRTSTGSAGAAPQAGGTAGLEELLAIAREAALAEGRMTRRALRPYLNEAGMPISNERFTELQQHLYADPKLAHLPRPGRRSR
jgi:hypothetical protein